MSVASLIKDPEFQKLSVEKQRQALIALDSDFSKLDDSQINEFKLKLLAPKGPQIRELTEQASLNLPEEREPDPAFLRALPVILGLGGTIAGGPIGGMTGAAAGSLIREKPQDILQDPGRAAIQAGLEGILSGVIDIGTAGLSRVAGSAKNRLLQSFFNKIPTHAPIEDAETLAKISELKGTVGQVKGSPLLTAFEHTAAPSATYERQQEQKQVGRDIIESLRQRFGAKVIPAEETVEETYGKAVQPLIKEQFEANKQLVNRAYNKVRFDADLNKITVKEKVGEEVLGGQLTPNPQVREIFKDRDIVGPVIYTDTANYIKKLKPEIDKLYAELPEIARTQLSKLKSTIDNLAEGITLEKNRKVYISDWETIKELRSEVNSKYSKLLFPNRPEANLLTLTNKLGKDIESSVATWEIKSPGALQRLKNANRINAEFRGRFPEKLLKKIYEPGEETFEKFGSPEEVFKLALRNPTAARKTIDMMGPQNASTYKAFFFDKLIESTKQDPKKMLEDFTTLPHFRKAFTSAERQNIEYFLKGINRTTQGVSKAGTIGWAYRGIGIALSTAVGTISFATGEGFPESVRNTLLAGGIIAVGANKFAKNILLNPKYARAAAKLANIAPTDPEAKFLTKTILGGLRGTQLIVELADGTRLNADVNDKGKVEIQPVVTQ